MIRDLRGVIDVGSNSIRLCVFEVVGLSGSYPLRKVYDEKKSAGLAGYVQDGAMSSKGIDVAAKAINHQLDHARMMGCPQTDVFATAAIRNCFNSAQVVSALEQLVRVPVQVLSERDEAYLGFCGMQPESGLTDGVVVDIGGGSTELSLVDDGVLQRYTSIPCGSLSLWARQGLGVFPCAEEFEQCRQSFRGLLRESRFWVEKPQELYGVGGSIRLANCLHNALCPDSSREGVVSYGQVREVVAASFSDPDGFARVLLRMDATRVHTALPGMAILMEVFDLTGAETVACCSHGVREGFVLVRGGYFENRPDLII